MRNFLLVLLLPGLTGCIQKYVEHEHPVPTAAPSVNYAETELSRLARSIEHSLRTLAAAEQVPIATALNTDPLLTADGNMGKKITLDWSGPIQPLIQQLADMTGYQLKTFGNAPAIPVIVSVVATNTTIADVVKDAGLQAGARANVVVFPKNKVIELRYVRA